MWVHGSKRFSIKALGLWKDRGKTKQTYGEKGRSRVWRNSGEERGNEESPRARNSPSPRVGTGGSEVDLLEEAREFSKLLNFKICKVSSKVENSNPRTL